MAKDQLSDEEFVHVATGLVNDASLLVSFLAGSWVGWYGYTLATSSQVRDYARWIRQARAQEPDTHDFLVPRHLTREFLKTAVPTLRSLREEGTDLYMAIAHVIAAQETTVLEERFTNFVFALEKLKDVYAVRGGREYIVDEGKWRVLKRNLGQAIRDGIARGELSGGEAASLNRKLPDLRRPALGEVLEDMLQTYRVSWRDLYPAKLDSVSPPFIDVRDKLLHSNRSVAPHRIWYEVLRVQAVVERVLLRMLGWADIDCSPRDYFREVLQSELGD